MPPRTPPLPADDPDLATLTLDELELRWSTAAARTAITAEAMTGADLKAQALGTPGEVLMEHAGTAVAAAARALVAFNGREDKPVLILAGPGDNGGDGFVAARVLAGWGTPVIAVLVAADERPGTPDSLRNWKRLDGVDGVTRIHAPVARDVAILGRASRRPPSWSMRSWAPASAASCASRCAAPSRSSARRGMRGSRSSPWTRLPPST